MSVATTPTDLLAQPDWYRQLPGAGDVQFLDDGIVAVTGFAAVREVLTHPTIVAEHPLKASARVLGPNVLDADGAQHRAFRSLLAPTLSAARINEYRQQLLPGLVDDLVTALAGTETDDFYGRYAHRIPYGLICVVLGINPALQDRFHHLTRPLSQLLDYPTVVTQQTHDNVAELLAIIDAEHATGSPEGQSLLATIERTRQRKAISLTDSELRSTALLFFIAGTETSSAVITSMIYCLGRMLHSLDELTDAAIRESFIEETLRMFPPVQTAVRFATEDVTIGQVTIPRHAAVVASIAGANRDPRVFAHPDRFVIDRIGTPAIPFAVGAHACPGSALAKTEFALLLDNLARRVSQIAVTRDHRRSESQSFAHPTEFTVQFTPR